MLALQCVRRRGGLGEADGRGHPGLTPHHLAAPFLPGEPGFSLISDDRRTLTLPHGGLIRRRPDGRFAGRHRVSVAGAPRTLVAANRTPASSRWMHSPAADLRRRAAGPPAKWRELPGQWERLAFLIAGELAVTVRAAEADVAALTAGIGRALAGPNRLPA